MLFVCCLFACHMMIYADFMNKQSESESESDTGPIWSHVNYDEKWHRASALMKVFMTKVNYLFPISILFRWLILFYEFMVIYVRIDSLISILGL